MKPSTQELKEMFDNNFDCWAKHKGEDGFPVMAMTNERFVEVVSNILALGKPEPLAKNKQFKKSCNHNWIDDPCAIYGPQKRCTKCGCTD